VPVDALPEMEGGGALSVMAGSATGRLVWEAPWLGCTTRKGACDTRLPKQAEAGDADDDEENTAHPYCFRRLREEDNA
jgi:hypothetical protein